MTRPVDDDARSPGHRLRPLERLRLEGAVTAYDFWLEVHDVPRRRRRDLRRELRANLVDSTADRSAADAVRALGSTRAMAADAAEAPDPGRPRWTAGLSAGTAVVLTAGLAFLLGSLSWLDGVLQTGTTSATTGALTLWPGSSLTYEPLATGFSLQVSPGWLPWAAAIVAVLLASRSWRLLRRRRVRT